MNKNKRGVSTIIATVLIILITIAAAGLIAQFIVPYVKNTLSKSSECLDYGNYFKFEDSIGDKEYNCYKSANGVGRYGSSVGAKVNDSGAGILGFNLIFTKEDKTNKVVQVKEINSILTQQMYDPISGNLGNNIKVPKNGDVYTYVYTDSSIPIYSYLEVAPVLKSGRVCAITDKIKINSCASGVSLS